MPRSRRRRQKDRRQEVEQRKTALDAIQHAKEHRPLGRYVRSVLQHRAGEIIERNGEQFVVREDGSLTKIKEGLS